MPDKLRNTKTSFKEATQPFESKQYNLEHVQSLKSNSQSAHKH